MTKILAFRLLVGCAVALLATSAHAVIYTANVTMNGANERPTPNNSTATGSAVVTFDSLTGLLSVNGSYQNLTDPVSGSHVHGPADVNNFAPVLIGLTNTGGMTGAITGSGNVSSANFFRDLLYVNVHSAPAFPGGEIRGQIFGSTAIPEPSSVALAAIGGAVLAGWAWRRRRSA